MKRALRRHHERVAKARRIREERAGTQPVLSSIVVTC